MPYLIVGKHRSVVLSTHRKEDHNGFVEALDWGMVDRMASMRQ